MAISYTKTNWVNGTSPAINATNLNNIENGVYNATTEANSKYAKPSNGIPKADLVNAVQASLNLADSSVQLDLLWENGSPTSDFSGRSVSVSGSGCDFYLVTFKEKKSVSRIVSTIFEVGMGSRVEVNANDISYFDEHFRTITASSSSSITFSDGWFAKYNQASQSDSGCCIPYKIYGIKGGL